MFTQWNRFRLFFSSKFHNVSCDVIDLRLIYYCHHGLCANQKLYYWLGSSFHLKHSNSNCYSVYVDSWILGTFLFRFHVWRVMKSRKKIMKGHFMRINSIKLTYEYMFYSLCMQIRYWDMPKDEVLSSDCFILRTHDLKNSIYPKCRQCAQCTLTFPVILDTSIAFPTETANRFPSLITPETYFTDGTNKLTFISKYIEREWYISPSGFTDEEANGRIEISEKRIILWNFEKWSVSLCRMTQVGIRFERAKIRNVYAEDFLCRVSNNSTKILHGKSINYYQWNVLVGYILSHYIIFMNKCVKETGWYQTIE